MATKPLVIAALGGRGSGKSAWVKQRQDVATAKRLIVWDYMHEYGATGRAVGNLGECIKAMSEPSWRLAYQVNHATQEPAFDLLCKAVIAAKKCTLIVEELAFVTKPGKAPPPWRELCLIGRHATHAQATLIGISQRPASIDKDFLACCDVIHCGRLLYEPDAKAVAPFIGCDWRELCQLPDLHYIERTAGGQTVRGVLTFDKKTTKKAPTPRAAKPA